MKNFKIVMILVAAVAFFCSCGEKTVTVTMTEQNNVVTYDLASANSLVVNFTCTVKAETGIKTIAITQTIMNGEETVATNPFNFTTTEYEGMAEYSFPIEDTLFKSELAAGYKVLYTVVATDKKDIQGSYEYPINVVETATALSANWSETIYITRADQTSWAEINGNRVTATENAIMGVKMGSNTSTETKINTTSNCEGFVVVEGEYTYNEQLAEAYTAGTAVTELAIPFDYHRGFSPKTFISKVGEEYVLVKVVSADNSPAGSDNISGTILGFQYKKAETAPVAAK